MATDAEEPAIPQTRINRGDVFWVAADVDGTKQSRPHPHVVVQDDVFNHSRVATVVACALTTNLHRASEPGNVLLDAGEGNLPRQSVVVVAQVASVEKARLGERIGTLSDERVEQVLAGLRFLQATYFGYGPGHDLTRAEAVEGHQAHGVSGVGNPCAGPVEDGRR